jgi:hypothetical protein
MRLGDVNDLMGVLPISAVIVSQRPPLWRFRRERRRCSAPLCRSCLRPDMAITGHVAVAGELTTHGAAHGGVV